MADPPKGPRPNPWLAKPGSQLFQPSGRNNDNNSSSNSSRGRAGHNNNTSRGATQGGASASGQTWPRGGSPYQQQSQGTALPHRPVGEQHSSSTPQGRGQGDSDRGQQQDASQRGGRGRGRGDGRGRGRGRGRGGNQGSRWGHPPRHDVQADVYNQHTDATTTYAVLSLENTLAAKTADQEYLINAEDKCVIVGRGQYGETGESTTVAANYLLIKPLRNSTNADAAKIHTYSVTVKETARGRAPSRVLKRQTIHSITNSTSTPFANIAWATDQASIIVTNAEVKFADPAVDPWTASVPLLQLPDGEPTARDAPVSGQLLVEVKHEHSLSLPDMITALKSIEPGSRYDKAMPLIQAMNIIISKTAKEDVNIASTSSNKFFAIAGRPLAETWQIHDHLLAQRGYYSSVRPATGQLLLNINVASAAFWIAMPLLQLYGDIKALTTQQKTAYMKGLSVRVTYISTKPADQKPRTIIRDRIVTAACEGNANTTDITLAGGGGSMTVAKYYLDTYGITLTDPAIVNVGSTEDGKQEYIPIEFCHIRPGQQHRRLLNTESTGNMIKFAARSPNQNAFSIAGSNDKSSGANALRVLNLIERARPPTGQDPQVLGVHSFGFEVGTDLMQIPGRFLAGVTVSYANLKPFMKLAGWNLSPQWNTQPQFIDSPGLQSWGVLKIEYGVFTFDDATIKSAMEELVKVLTDCGIATPSTPPAISKCTLTNPKSPDEKQRADNETRIQKQLQAAKTSGHEVLLVILPEHHRWIYSKIKSLAETVIGIHTICCIGDGEKLFRTKGQEQYLANLALKFNIKTGGSNHLVTDLWTGVPERVVAGNTMLVGIDVTHPSPDSGAKAPSITSLVANTDSLLGQWPGSLQARPPRVEILDPNTVRERKVYHHGEHIEEDIQAMLALRLEHWQRIHKTLPENIILYRDGVSESQYDKILDLELPALVKGCKTVYSNELPKLAIVVVGKRHHTRFYATKEADTVNNQMKPKSPNYNLKPGLVVDRLITHRTMREFFLQAHHGLQGSARPAHYVVLKDDIGFTTDQMEIFTHKLCYSFNRATKAVSICPPAYYADLLADRGRLYLHDVMNEGKAGTNVDFAQRIKVCQELENTTFYI